MKGGMVNSYTIPHPTGCGIYAVGENKIISNTYYLNEETINSSFK